MLLGLRRSLSSPAVPAELTHPTIHLRPTAPVAERVVLPGDPGRALALATTLLGDDRKMFNHHRGLWGYTGTAVDGRPLTIQSTGIGGASAAVVLEELAALGVRVAVRAGTATALRGELELGALVAATELHGGCGATRALGAPERQAPDPELVEVLAREADAAGPLASADLFYDPDPERRRALAASGALAFDLQSAALAAVAAARGLRFASVVAITSGADGGRLDDEHIERVGEAVGRAAAAALLACA
jgi:uridine phosphorylase